MEARTFGPLSLNPTSDSPHISHGAGRETSARASSRRWPARSELPGLSPQSGQAVVAAGHGSAGGDHPRPPLLNRRQARAAGQHRRKGPGWPASSWKPTFPGIARLHGVRDLEWGILGSGASDSAQSPLRRLGGSTAASQGRQTHPQRQPRRLRRCAGRRWSRRAGKTARMRLATAPHSGPDISRRLPRACHRAKEVDPRIFWGRGRDRSSHRNEPDTRALLLA